jgi:metal-responsive CopG/Arc/MetJ family transcriptional regulator
MQKVSKVTISLPQELLDLADRLAKERSTTRSAVIAELLEKEEQSRLHAAMAEGYREMAEEDRRLAEDVFPLASDSIRKSTRWDERANG